MNAKTKVIVMLLLLAIATPAMALFGPPTETFKGRINFIQQTNFTLLTEDSQLIRIMVNRDQRVPAEVQLGVKVEVKAVQGDDGQWYLKEFEKIELLPSP